MHDQVLFTAVLNITFASDIRYIYDLANVSSLKWSSPRGAWPLVMGPICCPETSATNYQSTLCNISEGRRSHKAVLLSFHGITDPLESSGNLCGRFFTQVHLSVVTQSATCHTCTSGKYLYWVIAKKCITLLITFVSADNSKYVVIFRDQNARQSQYEDW